MFGANNTGPGRENSGDPRRISFRGYRETTVRVRVNDKDVTRLIFIFLAANGDRFGMFNRQEWISRFGFGQEFFHPQLRAMGLPDCGGPFRGTCDPSIAGWIGDQLAADPGHRHFFYWLTLNSHLPVDPDREASDALGCGKASFAIKDDAACNLVALVVRVERAVSELAMRPDLPKTEFVIVGDHAPPFIFKKRRELFSQHEVPYIHLTPRH